VIAARLDTFASIAKTGPLSIHILHAVAWGGPKNRGDGTAYRGHSRRETVC
jgi:hypothetical protein